MMYHFHHFFFSMVVTDWTYSMVFWQQFFEYWWVEMSNIKFYKRNLLLFLIALNHSLTDLVLRHWLTCVFSLILLLISSVFANYSYFLLGRVNSSKFCIILEIYLVIFKSEKGFALVELSNSFVQFKLFCDDFCFQLKRR